MKKAKFMFLLLTIMAIFTINAVIPIKAEPIARGIFGGSPHPYTSKWPAMIVGWLTVWNEGSTLYVRYYSESPWEIAETHVAVAESLNDIPHTKSGNPKVGHFPYQMEHNPAVITYTYEIELDPELNAETTLYIAAHAVVQNDCQEETAWANCQGIELTFANLFGGKNWASCITYTLQ